MIYIKCTDTMISKFISFKDNGLIICTTVYIWRGTKTNHKHIFIYRDDGMINIYIISHAYRIKYN